MSRLSALSGRMKNKRRRLLATAIAKLPDQQAAILSRAYASSVAAKRMKTLAVLLVLAVLIFISGQMADIRP